MLARVRKFLANRRMKSRKIDVEIFWPACVSKASNINEARAAFALHAINDPNWTDDMNPQEIIEYVRRLDV